MFYSSDAKIKQPAVRDGNERLISINEVRTARSFGGLRMTVKMRAVIPG
jgi:hypothetical protein